MQEVFLAQVDAQRANDAVIAHRNASRVIVRLGHPPGAGNALDVGGAGELGNFLGPRVAREHGLGILDNGELCGLDSGRINADARENRGGDHLGGDELVELRIGNAEGIEVEGCKDVIDVTRRIETEGDARKRLAVGADKPSIARRHWAASHPRQPSPRHRAQSSYRLPRQRPRASCRSR